MQKLLGFFMSTLLINSLAYGLQIGQLAVGGNSCLDAGASKISFEKDILLVQTKTMVKKNSQAQMARGTCQFSLPIQLEANERLVVRHIDMIGAMNLGVHSQLLAQTEIFFAGAKGQTLKIQEEALDIRERKQIFNSQEVELSTKCGGSVILRGNSSMTITGAQNRSTARLDGVSLLAFVEECE